MKHTLLALSFCCILGLTSTAQQWEQKADMPLGKHHPVTFSLNGLGYAVTGTSPNNAPSRDAFRYNPATDSWEVLSSFPGSARSFAIGQAYNGKAYLGFGATTSQYLRDIWEYDPATGNWTLLTMCQCSGRRHPAFIIRDDKIFVGLGDDATGNLNDWWIYDMNTDTWTQQPNMPGQRRHHPFHFYAGDDVYAGFGHGFGSLIFRDWYRFDMANETWQQMADFPGEARVAGTQFAHGDYGYVLSGDGDDHSFMNQGEFWQYDHANDLWTQMTSHPGISRWAPGSFVINDTVYFMAGQNRVMNQIENDVWSFPLPVPVDTTSNDTTDTSSGNPTSVREIFETDVPRIYPNPASQFIQLPIENPVERIEFYGVTGQLIRSEDQPNATYSLDFLPEGWYMVRLTMADGRIHATRLVKQGY